MVAGVICTPKPQEIVHLCTLSIIRTGKEIRLYELILSVQNYIFYDSTTTKFSGRRPRETQNPFQSTKNLREFYGKFEFDSFHGINQYYFQK